MRNGSERLICAFMVIDNQNAVEIVRRSENGNRDTLILVYRGSAVRGCGRNYDLGSHPNEKLRRAKPPPEGLSFRL
jgi:hypothetical protein